MAMQSIKCPNCGANIEIDDVRDSFFCSYCGSPIQRDPNNTFTYRTVDVAKIKEIETNERLKEKEWEREKENNKDSGKILAGYCIFVFAIFAILIACFAIPEMSLKKEQQRLQGIVEEIQQDIARGDYDTALIKANGLYMTDSSWQSREKEIEQWNQQREDLIKLIKEKKERDKN